MPRAVRSSDCENWLIQMGNRHRLKAFTLIEVMVAMAITAITFALTSYGFEQANSWFSSISDSTEEVASDYLIHIDLENQFQATQLCVQRNQLIEMDSVSFDFGESKLIRRTYTSSDTINSTIEGITFNERFVNNSEILKYSQNGTEYQIIKKIGVASSVNQQVFGKD